ncbi:MAG: hypothetical protein COU81_02395 [Candidatus Portnoybacteria bacterium CG10_big_fil_rev_8_21_14_0_10_36_7]|uniref:Uncharacterized protein n=1 Tax=Candidatus Portnoybacteria bacterium CG10_big_fil_rev_8_21_14_0_10_36_7 TaxID=1974812 RepID=A0A2M8KDY9_9BACT|nr:MAG: hypothetical protein COU81_02395 [Candidatus Portnoybacteria bacterium CG10_big_fil_rev_8_21_14_0_10_36_7]
MAISLRNNHPDLFSEHLRTTKLTSIFNSMDALRQKFGKHTLFLGSSHLVHKFSQHLGQRGDEALRKLELLPGETKRRRLAIPIMVAENI